MAFHGDSRRTAPPDRYGVPGRQYPTPNINDVVRIEEVPRERPINGLIPGTPHPNDPTLMLVGTGPFKGSNNEVSLHYVYCSTRTAQDAYNASITYAQENHAYPIFRRTYFLPRQGFLPLIELTPLDSVIGLTLVSGGTGYNGGSTGAVPLTFTGGSGTGAAGTAQIVRGVIVALLLTNGGSGFITTPTVGIAGGTGGSITAQIQPQNCLLVKQEESPEEGEFQSLFLRVDRTWESLPGPEIVEADFLPMEGTGRNPVYCHNFKYTQRVAIGTPANPIPSLNIIGVSAANPAVITVEAAHGLANGSTFPIRIAGLAGVAGSLTDGDYTATATGALTLTVPVTTTQPTTANTGYLAWLKGGNIIIDSFVHPDEEAGSVTGTLITKTVLLPRTLTGKVVTKENGGAILTQSRTVQSNRTVPVSGTLVTESSIIELGNGMFIVMSEVADPTEWPVRFGTHLDPNFGVSVDISRQAVAAGTLGGLVLAGNRTIASIAVGNPCTITFVNPHYYFPGDSVVISGVSGGSFSPTINTAYTITPTGSRTATVPVNCTVAPTPNMGHAVNANTSDVYVDVQPVDYVSVRIASRLRASSVLGTGGWVTYPVTVEFKKPDQYGAEEINTSGSEAQLSFTATPGWRGSFQGYVSEGYFTKTQLDAWIPTYQGYSYTVLQPTVEKGVPVIAGGRLYSFRVPLSEFTIVGTTGVSGFGHIYSVHAESRELGIYRVLVTDIVT